MRDKEDLVLQSSAVPGLALGHAGQAFPSLCFRISSSVCTRVVVRWHQRQGGEHWGQSGLRSCSPAGEEKDRVAQVWEHLRVTVHALRSAVASFLQWAGW